MFRKSLSSHTNRKVIRVGAEGVVGKLTKELLLLAEVQVLAGATAEGGGSRRRRHRQAELRAPHHALLPPRPAPRPPPPPRTSPSRTRDRL